MLEAKLKTFKYFYCEIYYCCLKLGKEINQKEKYTIVNTLSGRKNYSIRILC